MSACPFTKDAAASHNHITALVVSPGFPTRPDACHFCQVVHEVAARLGSKGRYGNVRFGKLVTAGDAACEVTVTRRARSGPP